ncbi:MAG: hypothetical protein PVH61_31575 [Candidatus Aminicenantes bacterium]|jgi:hypothetical protein
MKFQIEKANQILHIVQLRFKTDKEAAKFYELFDSGAAITIQKDGDAST